MDFNNSYISCGIDEAHYLSEGTALEIATEFYSYEDDYPGFLLFSDVTGKNRGGLKLAAELRKLKVGTVTSLGPTRNPRSGNRIMLWVFRPNHKAFKKWYKEQK